MSHATDQIRKKQNLVFQFFLSREKLHENRIKRRRHVEDFFLVVEIKVVPLLKRGREAEIVVVGTGKEQLLNKMNLFWFILILIHN